MITPEDIAAKEFKKSTLGGYIAEDVDRYLNTIISDYEKLFRENVELKDKVAMLNEGIQFYKSLENTIQNTLVLAEKTAEEIKLTASKKAEHIILDAEQKSSQIVFEATKKSQEINYDVMQLTSRYENMKSKVRLFLNSELEILNNESQN